MAHGRDAPEDDPLARLSALVRADRPALVAAARSEGATPEEALECVQDALCTFLARDLTAPAEARATVLTMVRNAARNLRRRHHRSMPHAPIAIGDEPAAAAPNAEQLLAHAEDTVRLRECVSELCGVQRAVVTLRLLEERSGEDVAEALGVSRAYVDVLVHRAKAALRVCMRRIT